MESVSYKDGEPSPGDTATRFSVLAFRLSTTEKQYLAGVGLEDHSTIESALAECRDAGATDWMVFSFKAVRTSDGRWVPQSRPVTVESTIPRQILFKKNDRIDST